MQSLNNRDEMNESEVVNLPAIQTRAANRDDLPRLTEIYNYYVVHTPITFDVKPWAVEQRISWFEQFDKTGRYRLLVAEQDSLVVGYAGTTRFRPKAAYDTTVETTIYCAAEFIGKGLGTQLYAALFRLYPADIPIAVELIAVLGKYSNWFESEAFVQSCRNWVGRHIPGDDAMNVLSG